MFNLRFIFTPGSCGWFCLRFILKKRIEVEGYLSMLRMKEILNEKGYYCTCLKIESIFDLNGRFLTLVKSSNNLHYVVVVSISKEYVYYYDPLFVFVRKKKIVKFIKKWSNICLVYTKV